MAAINDKMFFWYELMTADVDAAVAFYSSVVGWNAQDFGGSSGTRYMIMQAGEDGVAGIMPLPPDCGEGVQPGWLGYIKVDDVDAAAERLSQAGGKVLRAPDDIPDVGRFAVAADPQGAAFLLLKPQPQGKDPTAIDRSPGHVGWHELYADDWQKAFEFYASQFGWTKAEAVDMGPIGTYQLVARGAETFGGMMNRMPGVPAPVWQFYFVVDGIDAATARVTAGGGKILMGPHEVPGGSWIVQCADPEGVHFALTAAQR